MSKHQKSTKIMPSVHNNKALIWSATIVSVGILFLLGQLVVSDFESFQSCNANGGNVTIANCGKESISISDVIIVVLFILSAFMVVKLVAIVTQTVRSKDD